MRDRGGVCPPPRHTLQPNPSYSWSCLHTVGRRPWLIEKMRYSPLELPRREHQAQPKPPPQGHGGGAGGGCTHTTQFRRFKELLHMG